MKTRYIYTLLLYIITATVLNAAQAEVPVDTSDAALKAVSRDAADSFMRRYGIVSADSLEALLRRDYTLCTGDESRVSRERLFRWKAHIDSMVMDRGYTEKLSGFIAATGIKAHEVRPCEPIVFHERRSSRMREADSLFAAQSAARERARRDSLAVANELKKARPNPADILNISAGMSRPVVQTILARNDIRTVVTPTHLQADRVRFDGLTVTIAFYFDDNDRLIGYELETEALRANQLDGPVRQWAARLANIYEKRLGPPNTTNRVGFRDIKQGQLSIVTVWERGPSRPKVLIGLATHNHLYYAKVMVSY